MTSRAAPEDADERLRRVVILGGGTAGWMAASYLQRVFEGKIRTTLLEAPSIPRIGVGEATVPNLQRVFFDRLGLAEDDWMRECNAGFKMAVKFVNWRKVDHHARQNHFYHSFGLIPTVDSIPLSQYWVRRRTRGHQEPVDYACYQEPPLMDAKLGPRFRNGNRATWYAWHFDASLVADFLKRVAVGWGVEHVLDELESVERWPNGYIKALHTKQGRVIDGDLFIDCSGFRSLLIGKTLGEPFLDMQDHLLCDSAVATAVPHDDARHGVEPYTSAIAMRYGWTWKIPMLGRFGSGYVYSSRFCSEGDAAEDFCRLWRLDPDKTELNSVRFRVGRNRRAWVDNCVSIGLSSCFVEPLESSGIYFIYAAIYQLAKHFPDRTFSPILRDRFNREIEFMFDDTRDFIQAHYLASTRDDNAFWLANKNDLKLSDAICDKLETYKAGLPLAVPVADENAYYSHFETEFRNFWTNSSYYCIWAGMGLVPERPLPTLLLRARSLALAETAFSDVKRKQADLLARLPSNYELLRRLHQKEGLSLEPKGAG